jgi:hypothetical protein
MLKNLLNAIERGLKWFLSSFDNSTTGSSARKWSAFVGVLTCLKITHDHTDKENLGEILVIWLVFVSVCLSIVTIEQVIRFREGKTSSVKYKEETTIETSTK